jgi:diadenosine tetraphosphate (Ap4A) HIT family hydrolase
MLSNEQTKEIKNQILNQIDENFPADQKDFAKQQVLSMTNEEFENFLIQNNIIKNPETPVDSKDCIFCSIIEGKTDSYKIGETEEVIAVLEINPISNAHVLIIPKLHELETIPDSIIEFSNKIAEKIKKIFSPKNVEIAESEMFNHKILNIVPVYNDETLSSKRKKASPSSLKEIQEKILKTIDKTDSPKEKPVKKEENEEITIPRKRKVLEGVRLPKRIP